MGKLFSLFDDKLRSPNELIAGPTQNLDSIGNQIEMSGTLLRKIRQFEIVRPKVDYSDFSNFVFFNSAYDYFNITGEKILNEYPFDGSSESIEDFRNSLDDYQRYAVDQWPSSVGYAKFDPANGFAYVSVVDSGVENGLNKTSLMSPGTGSFSVEFWVINPQPLTGSDDVMIVTQKVSSSLQMDGFTVYYSGSHLYMTVVSGSSTDTVGMPSLPGSASYYCFSYDRNESTPVMRAYSGSADAFPVLVTTVSGSVAGSVSPGISSLYMGSGSFTGKIVRPLTGSIDDMRLWKIARGVADISSSFNTRIFSSDDLYGLWRFSETGSIPSSEGIEREIVRDYSGKRLHGKFNNYYSSLRVNESILPYDSEDPILTLSSPEVLAHIAEQQQSASLYDRSNDNQISRMLPEQFFLLEEFKETTVLKDFVHVMGRFFDQIKVSIDQFVHVLKNDYGSYDQTPDALLQDVAKFFGWEFTGNFLSSDAVQYIIGKQVLPNTQVNKELDVRLYEIKNEFWKRTLINLMHLYKTKGTRESVESLMKIYGVNKNFVRLKEFGSKPTAGIATQRISSEKSVSALMFGSGSSKSTSRVVSKQFYGKSMAIESRVRFPTTTSTYMTASITTGSIWTLNSGSSMMHSLYFTKTDATDTTGSIIYSGSEGSVVLSSVPVFDNEWYNVTVLRDAASSSLAIDVRSIDRDVIDYHVTSSVVTPITLTSSIPYVMWLGATASFQNEQWMQEVRVWDEPLMEIELNDHAMNFQSFGTEEVDGLDKLSFHWRLNENVSASSTGEIYNSIYDFSGRLVSGSGYGFVADTNPYVKFLNEFNYIASPEFGWMEEKIRALGKPQVDPEDAFVDNPFVSLEFNLIDALNEDISQIIATLDGFNEFVASPVNRYRESYSDLDVLRFNYFKRLNGSINFRVFADLLEFFDRSFISMVRRLIPARAVFLGDEFVVESHMLERPKVQWPYRRREREFQPEGTVKVYIR